MAGERTPRERFGPSWRSGHCLWLRLLCGIGGIRLTGCELRAGAGAGEPKAALAREFGISRETVKPISPRRRYLNRTQHGRHSIAAGDSTVTSTTQRRRSSSLMLRRGGADRQVSAGLVPNAHVSRGCQVLGHTPCSADSGPLPIPIPTCRCPNPGGWVMSMPPVDRSPGDNGGLPDAR